MTEIEFIDSVLDSKDSNCLGALVMRTRISFIIEEPVEHTTIEKINAYNKHYIICAYGPKKVDIQIPRNMANKSK